MSELTDWLLSQIAADEQTARRVTHPLPVQGVAPMTLDATGHVVALYVDPGCVLVLCAAHRRIVEAHASGFYDSDLEVAVRALASAFAGRPGFKEEWAHE